MISEIPVMISSRSLHGSPDILEMISRDPCNDLPEIPVMISEILEMISRDPCTDLRDPCTDLPNRADFRRSQTDVSTASLVGQKKQITSLFSTYTNK